ncbi:hypothetical protein FR483_n648L [Paramecium bursaria Chlorella virus FR483]|uniref:Uncharacterized protein n648L n=1 Tax=Paramecium bursaria Chlorella virus FR483 TaxID=399781 RepID=A7J802_PBCVF|nr:hypothetical protein FR483_n648L [Paramecium bursaria Chlorella virus FR483]ABT15933.1 hypothetical protein FR483_n648L [Paramecium bursaria Chlorella virus FR483]
MSAPITSLTLPLTFMVEGDGVGAGLGVGAGGGVLEPPPTFAIDISPYGALFCMVTATVSPFLAFRETTGNLRFPDGSV